MSQENVEIVRRAWETVNSDERDVGDWLDGYLDVWLDEFFDPEIEWHDVPTLPNAGVHRGRDAFRRHLADYLEAWADSSFEVEDIRAVGDRVVVRGRYGGVGRESGAQVAGRLSLPATAVYEFRAGRIRRVQQFETHVKALEAVGLSEQDAHADS